MPAVLTEQTPEYIQRLILVRLQMNRIADEDIKRRFAELTGEETQPQSPLQTAIERQLSYRMAHLVTERLLADNRSVELLSLDDLQSMLEPAIDRLFDAAPEDPDPETRATIKRLIFGEIQAFAAAFQSSDPGKPTDAYDTVWQDLARIERIAAEAGVPPAELIATQAGRDALLRSATSPDQLANNLRQTLGKIARIDKAQIINDALPEADKLDAEEIADVRANSAELVEQIRQVYVDWYTETTARVWGQARTL